MFLSSTQSIILRKESPPSQYIFLKSKDIFRLACTTHYCFVRGEKEIEKEKQFSKLKLFLPYFCEAASLGYGKSVAWFSASENDIWWWRMHLFPPINIIGKKSFFFHISILLEIQIQIWGVSHIILSNIFLNLSIYQ